MLKKETIDLVKDINFKNIFSICIGKIYLFQSRFIDYLGNYNSWDTNVKEGILKLDDRKFNVEYIGTTSDSDNYWYSSELESVIPDSYVDLMMKTRKYMDSLGLNEFTKDGKIVLDGDINGYNLSMIYIAFAPLNVAYFCGSGNTNIYMFVKDLPDEIFKKMNSVEFSSKIMKIISTFNVDHRLMTKALLIENDIPFEEATDKIIAKFNEKSIISVKFNSNNLITNISGDLSL